VSEGRFAGKTVVITGVAKTNGIGFGTARVFADEGASLALVDVADRVHECAEQLRQGDRAISSHTADLTKSDEVQRVVDDILGAHQKVDVLVNNAGMVRYGEPDEFVAFQDLTEAQWDYGIEINLKSQFLMTRAVLGNMIERRYGRIVNVSSVTGPLVANPERAPYCAAKAGVVGLTRGLALDVAKYGITANAVGPGWVSTGSSSEGETAGGLNTPMKRSASPAEIGKLIAFLASNDASYITGQLIVVDGGNTIQEYKGPSELYY
jgi:3-oxoacyl-[acyl-carrier protein] reductase